ncbi:MAG: cytochrome c oxidase assembly factor 1 family protein, partial [Verrucomicrobiota bacterium]|nr:cytochrome c oxidase assembly factor 1 family protein [Verrucomicrobiota bacterium]
MDTPSSSAPLNAPTSPPPSAPQPGWWSRNWKWFVPTGCLTFVLLGAAFVAVIVVLVFGALKSTDVYKTAVARAKANQEVRTALGDPIVEGMFLSGSEIVLFFYFNEVMSI